MFYTKEVIIFKKLSDFINIFSKKLTTISLKYFNINKYIMNLE